jgi:hypothetical protein
LVGKTTDRLTNALESKAGKATDQEVRDYWPRGDQTPGEAVNLLNSVLHARPATHLPKGPRLYRWHPTAGEIVRIDHDGRDRGLYGVEFTLDGQVGLGGGGRDEFDQGLVGHQ